MIPATPPILVAHRGWPARYPENTLEGFAAAAAAGARWLECDVQVSADGVPFVCHDLSLRRTAALDRNITELTARQLQRLSAGEPERFGTRYAETKLPALTALMAWLGRHPAVRLFVEIKRQSLRHHGVERVVTAVMNALAPALAQCAVISFDPVCLELAREHGAPAIGWAVEDAAPQAASILQRLKPDYLFTAADRFAGMREAFGTGRRWVVYHTEQADRALALAAQGAAFVETNDIGALLADPRFQAQ